MPRAEEILTTHTRVVSARLCPEIQLHLITAASDLWRASEEQAAAAGLVDPYWAFCWAGGQALARYVLDHPETVQGKAVLDFGAGGAVEGIASALGGGDTLCADIDPVAAFVAERNAALNGVELRVTTDNLVGRLDLSHEVVLAGDVFYGTEMAGPVIRWLRALSAGGATVLIGDPDRGFLDTTGLEPLARYDAPADNDSDGSFMKPTTVYRIAQR